MKKYLLVIFIVFLVKSLLICAEKGETKEEYIENKTNFNSKRYKTLRSLYWSFYGVTGFTALINTFAHVGNAYSISSDINSLSDDVKNYGVNVGILSQIANYYPAFIYGFHFVVSGIAFIPYAGGIAYGTLCYAIAIAFSYIKGTTTQPFNMDVNKINIKLDANIPLSDIEKEKEIKREEYSERLWDLYNKILDPTPYFVIGTLSILFGIGEIITGVIYSKEKYKKKYPFLGKNLFISPFGIIVRFNV